MREGSSKVRAINIGRLLLGHVDVLASRTIDFHTGYLTVFADADGDHILLFAEDSGAGSELACQVLLSHYGEAFWCGDEA